MDKQKDRGKMAKTLLVDKIEGDGFSPVEKFLSFLL